MGGREKSVWVTTVNPASICTLSVADTPRRDDALAAMKLTSAFNPLIPPTTARISGSAELSYFDEFIPSEWMPPLD